MRRYRCRSLRRSFRVQRRSLSIVAYKFILSSECLHSCVAVAAVGTTICSSIKEVAHSKVFLLQREKAFLSSITQNWSSYKGEKSLKWRSTSVYQSFTIVKVVREVLKSLAEGDVQCAHFVLLVCPSVEIVDNLAFVNPISVRRLL